MPLYQQPPYVPPFTPQVLTPGRPITVWASELLATPSTSAQFCIHRQEFPAILSVDVQFLVDPGVFQIDFQTSDVDDDAHYVTKDSLTGGLNGFFVGRLEVVDIVAKFGRLILVSTTNAANVTAKVY